MILVLNMKPHHVKMNLTKSTFTTILITDICGWILELKQGQIVLCISTAWYILSLEKYTMIHPCLLAPLYERCSSSNSGLWYIHPSVRPSNIWTLKPFYGDQKQAKQANADQCRPGQTNADYIVLVGEVVLVVVLIVVLVVVLVVVF